MKVTVQTCVEGDFNGECDLYIRLSLAGMTIPIADMVCKGNGPFMNILPDGKIPLIIVSNGFTARMKEEAHMEGLKTVCIAGITHRTIKIDSALGEVKPYRQHSLLWVEEVVDEKWKKDENRHEFIQTLMTRRFNPMVELITQFNDMD